MARETVRGVRSCGLALALLGGFVGSPSRGGAMAKEMPPVAARWVSADAVIVVEMSRPGMLLDRLTDERLAGPLGAIPSVKSALGGQHVRKLREVADLVAGKLGMTPEKALRALTDGGAVLAVEADEGQTPRTFLVVTPTDPALLKKASGALLELARKDEADKGKSDQVHEIKYRGATGYSLGSPAVYGIVKDHLIIADRVETAKAVIDRALDGPGAKGSFADSPRWSSRWAVENPDIVFWGFARLDRLRKLDPKRFGDGGGARPKPQETLLLGAWAESARKSPWLVATLAWSDRRLAAELTLPAPPGGRGGARKGFVPPRGAGAPSLLNPPGTIASVGLWRDLAAVWEARTDLFAPEDVQNLAKLDTFAGQFFGGRDFGTGVLGALSNDWRLVVALQDYAAMSPSPDVKAPAFALVMDVKPDDADFSERLRVAFQSFIGLSNLGAAQSKAPPLDLGSETFEGVTISTTRYMGVAKDKNKAKGEGVTAPVHARHNFSPSVAQVGNHFILSSSLGLTRDLVKTLQTPGRPEQGTLVAAADGATLATLVDLNRTRLVLQNMLEKGHDKEQAEAELGMLTALLRYLGHGRLSIQDRDEATRLGLEFSLGK